MITVSKETGTKLKRSN